MAQLELLGKYVASSAPEINKESYRKPALGEIDDIVQADVNDKAKRPEEWKTWKYEAVLVIKEDDDVSGPERSLDEHPLNVFEQGEMDEKEW
eukprot:CAMPEP_0117082238 /NCGR_PEP_ID=MMETSP0472-20121206/57923_1 /TAXON_ID=693140 ORGANISM="Tiarina fusus, Strain LIS" /NCGR_SAMPLE_ID=MMETSP0472 /ASSEMBLY_ACC=CAM_ASM_000603 /LENGTH=91 /DNA_ID=CAMNT_0004810417 /DNA_START=703 /DNA_END=975 /DNA_ORIENTATION=-